MATILRHFRLIAAVLALDCIVAAAMPAPSFAQQINPTADAVNEQTLLGELNRITGRCTLPDQKACTLEQPAGRDWRQFHQRTLPIIGAVAIIGMLVLLVLFYLIRGMVRIEHGRSGRVIVRFSTFERLVHWMTASCFVILALSGLNITFGKQVLLPLIGEQSFAEVSQWLKYSHNYLSFPFTLGVVLMFLMWIAWNIPTKVDVNWIKEGGGLVGDRHPPAARFNAGQKMIYWIVVFGGAAAAVSGYLLMFPFYGTNIADMQLAQTIHAVVAMLFIAAMLAHIYIGTIGMEGAVEAMWTGTVDVNWAKEHHSLWLAQEEAKGHVSGLPPEGRMQPAE